MSRTFLHRSIQLRDERAGALETLADLGGCLERGASPRHQRTRLQSRNPLECGRPLREVGIPCIGCCIELDEVAGEQHLIPRQPHYGVTFGVSPANLHDANLEFSEPQRQLLAEHNRRPGEARDRLHRAKQPRKPLDLTLHIRRPTLDDELVRVLAGDDVFGLVGARTEHAHRVVMRQDHVLDRLVRHFANPSDHILGHDGRRLRVDHHHGIVSNDDARVRVALGGVGIGMPAELLEAHDLLGEIGLRGKCLAHQLFPSLETPARATDSASRMTDRSPM